MKHYRALYFAAHMLVATTAVSAEEVTWAHVNTQLDITAGTLATLRAFAKGCNLTDGEVLARLFVEQVTALAPVRRIDIERLVETKYRTALSISSGSRECQPENVRFWANSFQAQFDHLLDALRKFRSQRR